jgi:hypothetical protein
MPPTSMSVSTTHSNTSKQVRTLAIRINVEIITQNIASPKFRYISASITFKLRLKNIISNDGGQNNLHQIESDSLIKFKKLKNDIKFISKFSLAGLYAIILLLEF